MFSVSIFRKVYFSYCSQEGKIYITGDNNKCSNVIVVHKYKKYLFVFISFPVVVLLQTTPTAQQTTPITANGSVPGCTSIISSSGVVCGPGAGVGCTSSLQPHQQASSLSPGSSDGGQQQQPQQNLQQLQLSLQNLGLAPAPAQSNQNTGPGAHPPPQHSSANPPLQQHLSSSTTSSSSSYPRPPIPSCLSAPVCPNPLLQKEWEKVSSHIFSPFSRAELPPKNSSLSKKERTRKKENIGIAPSFYLFCKREMILGAFLTNEF